MEPGKTISKCLFGKCLHFSLQIDCFLCFPLLYLMKKSSENAADVYHVSNYTADRRMLYDDRLFEMVRRTV